MHHVSMYRKSDRPNKYKSLELSKKQKAVSTWKKQADKIIQDAGKSTPKRKRLRRSPHIELEQSLILQLREMCSLDVPLPVTYMMLHLKAEL